MSAVQEWTMTIESRRHWRDLRLTELWRYRDLIRLFVWRDFVAQYKQTVLGPLWYLLQPLATTLTFTVVFGSFVGVSTDGQPQVLFYMASTTMWSYFAACLTRTSNTFIGNTAMFGKVYFPRLSVPLAILVSNGVGFVIQFAQLVAFLLYFVAIGAVRPDPVWLALLPALLLVMAALGLGCGIAISALTMRYRDLQFVVTFGVQLLMFVTPVIFPLSTVPERWRWLVAANPLTPLIEGFRRGVLGAGTVSAGHVAYSVGITLIVLLAGILAFNRVEDTSIDTV